MKIKLITVGRKPADWLQAGFENYAKRMPKDMQLQLIELTPKKHKDVKKALLEESQLILKQIDNLDWVVVLDERGKMLDSKQLALQIERWREESITVVFVVGSVDGLHVNVISRANQLFSLSKLTLPHQLVRVVLAEALYRAWSICSGHPYHRE